MITQSLQDRDVRILDAKHFDGPDALSAMLGFLGADTQGSPAATGHAAEPAWRERRDDAG